MVDFDTVGVTSLVFGQAVSPRPYTPIANGLLQCHDCRLPLGVAGFMLWCAKDQAWGDPSCCGTGHPLMVFGRYCLGLRLEKYYRAFPSASVTITEVRQNEGEPSVILPGHSTSVKSYTDALTHLLRYGFKPVMKV